MESQTAKELYTGLKFSIKLELRKLNKELAKYDTTFKEDSKSWAVPNDLGHILEELVNISKFVRRHKPWRKEIRQGD